MQQFLAKIRLKTYLYHKYYISEACIQSVMSINKDLPLNMAGLSKKYKEVL